ncbi:MULTISPECIES: GDSL-type esterase/lipase family protein [Actinoalloteichus]|uniref:Lysophospholipase L1-like esterase n=1 Tax=Actinoalloteichus fjordicus TaxID=1612552 RepID=A0AAC9PPZ3_9PSEU|nr:MULTISPECIES: GDSL-type esterase/lipase family protein [Actinoalloteichus]APU12530.1 lysophospholipase L1-like esterase [Actinoalloteichus fjordicus]APU18484.1 lysophospholipase L1-like esterase [Actinoalloteichus sp. GBA129-24]
MRRLTSAALVLGGLAVLSVLPMGPTKEALPVALDPQAGITTWSAAPQPPQEAQPESLGFTDVTVRTVIRVSAGGDAISLRLDNTYGLTPLDVEAVTLARPLNDGPAIALGGRVRLRDDGQTALRIPAGESVYTDPVPFAVRDGSRLVVSYHLPGPTGPVTLHSMTGEPTWLATGEHSMDAGGAMFERHRSRPVVGAAVIYGGTARGTVVVLGSSTADGVGSDMAASRRWPDLLSDRLAKVSGPRTLAVANASISGNQIITSTTYGGSSQLDRLDRDVLSLAGARTVILNSGGNDLRNGADTPTVLAALEDMADQSRARGLFVVVTTVTPFGAHRSFSPEVETARIALNAALHRSTHFDLVVDLDTVVRDPERPERLRSDLDVGDGSHPNQRGAELMADAVPIAELPTN